MRLTYRRLAWASLALQDPECLFLATNLDAADNVGSGERPRLMPGAATAVGFGQEGAEVWVGYRAGRDRAAIKQSPCLPPRKSLP